MKNTVEQRIIFFYEKTEYDLDHSKVYTCISSKSNGANNTRFFTKELIELKIKIVTTCIFDNFTKFQKGTIIIENQEFNILDYNLYYYLPVENKIYSRIGVCEIDKDTFFKIKMLKKEKKI